MGNQLDTVDVPLLDRLSDEGVERVHEASMHIIEEFGIRFDHEDALRIFDEHDADVDEENQLVKIPRHMVEEAVESAPSSYVIRGRGSQPDVTFGGDSEPIITSASGSPNIYRYDEGRRSSRLTDYEDLQKIIQMTDEVTLAGSGICVANDLDEAIADYETKKRDLVLTNKIPGGNSFGEDRARGVAEMVGIVHDDPDLSDYYLITIANSVSPRTWDRKMSGGVLEHARMEQPVILSPAVMSAASGPATLPGSMALANAEILAGLTLTQLVNEGTPVAYGLPSSNIDIRYGSFSIGSPEGALFISFAGQMARYYDIPSRAGGGLTDSKTVDDQAGSEAMLQLFMSYFSGIDYISHAVGILDSYSTVSPEKLLLDVDRIRYLKRFEEGYTLEESTFALDLIGDVEPADHFLNERHTFDNAEEEFLIPELSFRDSYDNWENQGANTALERAHDRFQAMLTEYEPPDIDRDIRRDLDRYVEDKREEVL